MVKLYTVDGSFMTHIVANAPLPNAPRTRADCAGVERPCPYGHCRYNLVLSHELDPSPDVASCALDVADEGEHTLDEIGTVLGLTRERVRQIEAMALRTLVKTCGERWR